MAFLMAQNKKRGCSLNDWGGIRIQKLPKALGKIEHKVTLAIIFELTGAKRGLKRHKSATGKRLADSWQTPGSLLTGDWSDWQTPGRRLADSKQAPGRHLADAWQSDWQSDWQTPGGRLAFAKYNICALGHHKQHKAPEKW